MTTQPNPMQVPIVDYNLLPLETWRQRIGFHPWHFWQLSNSKTPITSACNSLVNQHSWQSADESGRSEIVQAIMRAETRLSDTLRFSIAPRYREVQLQYPQYPKPNIARLGYADASGRWERIRLPEGYVQALGVETLTLLDVDAAVVYSDVDGDGLKEKFTVTVPVGAITNPREIAVYFGVTDRNNEDVAPKWRILPVKVVISGGNAIIAGWRWQLVRPVLYEGVSSEALDPDVDANFASVVSVYRRYTNQDGNTNESCQALLIWESPPYPQWACAYSVPSPYGLDPAGVAFAIARASIADSKNGLISLGEAIYDTASGTWNAVPWYASSYKFRPPDRVIVRYLAGYPTDDDGNVQEKMAGIVEALAAAELNRRICACDAANRQLYHWQFDLARTAGSGDEAYGMMSREDLNNPFGTRRGQVYAYKNTKLDRVLAGFAV